MKRDQTHYRSDLCACVRLMRFDKPVGFFLLLWPTWWALWTASAGKASWSLWVIFTAGVFVMRSAGCVINDIADRRFDPHVARTANRPLARGDISLTKAWLLLSALLLIALLLVMQLNLACFLWACLGAIVTLIYPFMKRWIAAPQCVLGIAFSLGIPMAYAALFPDFSVFLKHFSWILWAIGLLWPVIYDTLYAMTDRQDDLKLGIHSTAILFGHWDRRIIALLECVWFILWWFFAREQALGNIFYVSFSIAIECCLYEHWMIRNKEPARCFRAFLNHAWIGGILFLGLVLV